MILRCSNQEDQEIKFKLVYYTVKYMANINKRIKIIEMIKGIEPS